MPESKHRKKHKQQLSKFKTKQQKMSQQLPPQMPEVRNVPVWASDAKIEISGFEWEAIQNGLVQVQIMQQAAQAVMTRNIVNGTIKMDFEKLNPKTLQYEPMTDEEKAPHQAQFAKIIETIKAGPQPQPQKEAEEPSVILNAQGESASKSTAEVATEAVTDAPKEEAKVIKLDAKTGA